MHFFRNTLTLFICLTQTILFAQPGDGGPGGDPDDVIPINQYVILLIVGAVGFAVYKIISDKKKKQKSE